MTMHTHPHLAPSAYKVEAQLLDGAASHPAIIPLIFFSDATTTTLAPVTRRSRDPPGGAESPCRGFFGCERDAFGGFYIMQKQGHRGAGRRLETPGARGGYRRHLMRACKREEVDGSWITVTFFGAL